MLVTLLAVELLHALGPARPAPGLILAMGVTYAAARGGALPATIGVVAGTVFLAVFDVIRNGDKLAALDSAGSFLVVAAVIAAVVTDLRTRAARRLDAERRHAEQAENLEEAKSAFLQLASHELRGPLGLISGYVAMLDDGSFGPADAADIRVPVPILRTKVFEMQSLVDSLLQQARLDEAGELLDTRRVDLRTIVNDAVRTIRPIASPRHDIRWEAPHHEIVVNADPARVQLIVTGLLHNAVKYSPHGGVIQVFLSATAADAVISVWDHGLGIASRDLPLLFQRFGRIVTRENASIGGLGLGLYLAQELARLHGGDIRVQSVEGKGSTFTVLLPLATAATLRQGESLPAPSAAVPGADISLEGAVSRSAARG